MTALRIVGKLFVSIGVGILLFVAWTLWGTGLYTEREQGRLEAVFDQRVARAAPAEETEGPPRDLTRRLGPGDPVFRLRIPAIDVDRIVVEGVATEHLRLGPGHYPQCREGFPGPLCMDFPEVFPGQEGRVIVSGHRTTYGAPFWDIDRLEEGDDLITETPWGRFTYTVTDAYVVLPSDATVVRPSDKAELVLTTCHPKYSAAQRLIVVAEMEA